VIELSVKVVNSIKVSVEDDPVRWDHFKWDLVWVESWDPQLWVGGWHGGPPGPDGAQAEEEDGVKPGVCKAVKAAEATTPRRSQLTGSFVSVSLLYIYIQYVSTYLILKSNHVSILVGIWTAMSLNLICSLYIYRLLFLLCIEACTHVQVNLTQSKIRWKRRLELQDLLKQVNSNNARCPFLRVHPTKFASK